MGLLDRFREGAGVGRPGGQAAVGDDEAAIARYRYMLKTAPPETIEQAHAEAFAQLTPEQRQRVLQELSNVTPPAERLAVARAADSPGELARFATRAEIREPGVLERIFGRVQQPAVGMAGPSMGAMFGGTLLSSMAGTVLGSMIAQHFFNTHADALHQFGGFMPEASAGGRDFRDQDSSFGNDAGADIASDPGVLNDDGFGGGGFGDSDFGGTLDV
jgi:hypothetical protein